MDAKENEKNSSAAKDGQTTTPPGGSGANGAGSDGEQSQTVGASPEESQTGPTSALSAAIANLVSNGQATHERLLRTAAEHENFKKRSRRDASEAVKRAEEKVVVHFLPVLDNLERALAHVEGEQGGLVEGVQMVHKQFLTTLGHYDIKPFESVGEPFNPERHEAIQQMASEQPAGTVCQELQKGYCRGERLVRPAMVVVSLGPAEGEKGAAEKEA